MLKMGLLQKDPLNFETTRLQDYTKAYSLIVVDEAHNYRSEDAYRTRNLRAIIDKNGEAKVLFLTATPINTSLDDLLNLIKLYHRSGANLQFDRLVRELADVIAMLADTPYEKLSPSDKERIKEVQTELEVETFVKSTRWTIKSSKEYLKEIELFTGVDISTIPDPEITEVEYSLSPDYKDIVNGIIDFITGLKAAHLRIIEPEKGARLWAIFQMVTLQAF